MGLEFELLSGDQLQPIRTAAAAASAATTTQPDGDVDGCATPTSAANVLLAPLVCPPAPRKPRPPAKRKLQHRRGRRCGSAAPPPAPALWFIAVPHDVLAAVFVARPASACRPPAAKKVRVPRRAG